MTELKAERPKSWLGRRARNFWAPEAVFTPDGMARGYVGTIAGRPRVTRHYAVGRARPDAEAPKGSRPYGRPSLVRLVTFPMVLADLAAMMLTCLIVYAVAHNFAPIGLSDFVAIAMALFVPVALGNLLTGLYPGAGLNPVVEFRQLSRVSAIAFMGTAVLAGFGKLLPNWHLFFGLAWPLHFALAPLSRAMVRRVCRRYPWWGYPVLIFGAGSAATTVVQNLLRHPEYGLRPCLVMNPSGDSRPVLGLPVVGTPRLAAARAKQLGINYAIVALPDLSRPQATRVLERYAQGIRHVMITSAISPFAPGLPILWRDTRDLAGVAGVEVRNRLLVPMPRMIKRSMDLVLTVIGGLCLLPLMAVLAVLVKLSSPGPIFYGQARAGARGRKFKALKFRSMVVNGDALFEAHLAANPDARAEWDRDQKLKDDPRVTKIGALMRKYSLDELPQLWNVLIGEMSLVGPRPIPLGEITRYGKCYSIYKAVRPGITGLWQVSGRNDTAYAERMKYVEYYVRNWSPWFDIHLLARTVSVLLFKTGAY